MKETLADCQQSEEILACLKEFSANPRGFLLLAGKNGTGKTYAAKAAMNDCRINFPYHGEFYNKVFTKQTDLNFRWNENWRQWSDTTSLVKYYSYPEILIIDDLGTRTPTEAFMDFLYVLIDKRYDDKHLKGTILTTNLNSAIMREKFGDAFVSRVASGEVFRFEGKDRRFKDF